MIMAGKHECLDRGWFLTGLVLRPGKSHLLRPGKNTVSIFVVPKNEPPRFVGKPNTWPTSVRRAELNCQPRDWLAISQQRPRHLNNPHRGPTTCREREQSQRDNRCKKTTLRAALHEITFSDAWPTPSNHRPIHPLHVTGSQLLHDLNFTTGSCKSTLVNRHIDILLDEANAGIGHGHTKPSRMVATGKTMPVRIAQ